VFHIELRQFPHTARAFNLSREELHVRFVVPWLRGQVVQLDSQRFAPERAKLTIYEGRELQTVDLGLGRGWQNATRTGQDVTERELGAAEAVARKSAPRGGIGSLKDELAALCEAGTVSVPQALALATGAHPTARLSERLSMAELAVWELLQEGRVRLLRAGAQEEVPKQEWEAVLLAPATWLGTPAQLLLEGTGRGG
jgi:hypothetical protein